MAEAFQLIIYGRPRAILHQLHEGSLKPKLSLFSLKVSMNVQSSNLLITFMVTVEVKEHSNVSDNGFYPEVDRKKILSVRLSELFLWLAVISYTLVCSL